MTRPEEREALAGFLGSLGQAPARVLLLDYDGTLAPFRVERDLAAPYDGVRAAVERLVASGQTRVVVISGRTVADLRRLLGVEPPPELWGTHGWERQERGGPHRLRPVPPVERAALARADALAVPPERVEKKPASIAVHVRGLSADDQEVTLAAARALWEPLAAETGLELHPFDGGLELRVRGWNKGDAVRAVLADEPIGASVAYLGDDLTDEDAFAALDEGTHAGRIRALTALVRGEHRTTRAAVWLRPPDELLAFLEEWEHASG